MHEVRVTISCMSYEFLFAYCRSYELLFLAWVTSSFYKRVVIYCTSYELIFTWKLRVTVYSTSYELILKVNFYVWITSYYLWQELRVCFYIQGGCFSDSWKRSFLLRLIFNWRTFSRRVTACWWRQWAKIQMSTNHNSRNRWCQIVSSTVCELYYLLHELRL